MKTSGTLLLIVFLTRFFDLQAGKTYNWKDDFSKSEIFLIQGDYKNAQKKNQLFFSNNLKYGKNDAAQAAGYFQLARIYNGLGDFAKYESSCKHAVLFTETKSNQSNKDFSFVLAEAIKTYLDYGDILKASQAAHAAEQLISQSIITDSYFIQELRYLLARVYERQGYLLKAQALLPPIKKFRFERIVTKEVSPDKKSGTMKMKSLSSAEIKSRKRAYADLLNFEVRVLCENGLTAKADSLQMIDLEWISDNLGGKDFAMVQQFYTGGLVQEQLGEDKAAYEAFTDALDLYAASKGMHYTHYCKETGELFQKAILMEEKIGKSKEAGKDQTSYDSKIKRFFGKKNFYFAQTYLLETEESLIAGDWEDAKITLSELLDENGTLLPALHLQKARALRDLYKIHLLDEDYAAAENDLREIIRISETLIGPETPAAAEDRLLLASFETQYAAKFKEAVKIFTTSFEGILSLEKDHRSPAYTTNAFEQIKYYQTTEQYAVAQKLMDRLLAEIKKNSGTGCLLFAQAQQRAASLDLDMGKYKEVDQKLNNALSYFKNRELHSSSSYGCFVESELTLARLQMTEGMYEEAEKSLKKAAKLGKASFEHLYKRREIGREDMARLHMHTGKYQEAGKNLNLFLKAKQKRPGSYDMDLINSFNLSGNLQLITGDYTAAEKSVRKALSISQKIFGDSSMKYAESLKLLGNIYSAIGDYEHAEESIRKVLEIQRHKLGPNNAQVATSFNDLALIKFLHKGKSTEVEKLFEESLSTLRTSLGEQTPQYMEVLKNLSLYYMETMRFIDASKQLEKVNEFWTGKLGKQNIHSAEIFMLQANMLSLKGDYHRSKDKYMQARDSYASIFDAFHPNYVKAVSRIGQVCYNLGDYKGCLRNLNESTGIYLNFIKKYFPSLSEREKNKFWALIKNDFEFYNNLAVTLRESNPELISNAYNFALFTKSLLLNSSIKVRERILSSGDTTLIKKYEDWQAKKEYLVNVISMSMEQRKANQVDVKEIEKEIEALEKDLSASSELFAADGEREVSYTWEKLKENLQPNEVAIEMIRFRKFNHTFTDSICYAALLVSAETKSHPQVILFDNGKDLENKYLRYYRNSIRLRTSDKLSYEQFWQPLEKFVKAGTTIYFSSDGVFSQLNLETLETPNGKFLVDNNDIVLLNSTRDLIRKEKTTKSKKTEDLTKAKVSLFGNPTYYTAVSESTGSEEAKASTKHTIAQLPGAEKEVKALFDLLKSSKWEPQLYLENEAQEGIVKNLRSPKVFHIATHGFFLEDENSDTDFIDGLNENRSRNPLLRSGLLLTNGGKLIEQDNVYDYNLEDGILTAYEAMNLNLDKTDLVVLSACETALGDVQQGEGVYGLQRSFQVAGAKSIVMSLFKVSDEVTQELMFSFYKKWITTGDKRKSFTEAKKEIKAKYPEPLYWGSFVMVGTN